MSEIDTGSIHSSHSSVWLGYIEANVLVRVSHNQSVPHRYIHRLHCIHSVPHYCCLHIPVKS